VWKVVLEASASKKQLKSWDEIWRGPEKNRDILLLLTEPQRDWPKNPLHYWRSRIVVGDLKRRSVEDIMHDFGTLIRQTPPVLRNWRKALDAADVSKRHWHIVWIEEVARVG